ncbi:hypothetical protein K466DRAFT_24390 [Polyporus arcularius HHB13444]|uniref:Uncharacterized protein n=1 Tax=Polyporus arcularius HHB13444 TaxID=1314778 RepID=A0A5C3NQN1_9APHY|nr:hypothetical protein K466DRAFT_24390 [Polyporus arcularius HHB13444]
MKMQAMERTGNCSGWTCLLKSCIGLPFRDDLPQLYTTFQYPRTALSEPDTRLDMTGTRRTKRTIGTREEIYAASMQHDPATLTLSRVESPPTCIPRHARCRHARHRVSGSVYRVLSQSTFADSDCAPSANKRHRRDLRAPSEDFKGFSNGQVRKQEDEGSREVLVQDVVDDIQAPGGNGNEPAS